MKLSSQISLHKVTRILVFLSGLILIAVIFLPIWRIELTAPQYPEGLVMKIYTNKLGGAVDIINGLNHYIGMKELHEKDFIEFTVLPYIIGFFALMALSVVFVNRKWYLYLWSFLFVLFGVLSMVDFYRWLYDYGHDLNPHAAIQVPGMTYQPPMIGFKQLLNFGAYSIPDVGGWAMAGIGVIIVAVVSFEFFGVKKNRL